MRTRPVRAIRPSHPAVTAIRAESARVGWPLRFATDLDHDERHITVTLGDEPFGWVLRTDGTHIAPIAPRSRLPRALTCATIADAFGSECCRFYVWDGSSLTEYPTATVADEQIKDQGTEYHDRNRVPIAVGWE